MSSSGHPTLNLNMRRKQEKATINQVVTFKPSSIQRIIQTVQTVAQKGCLRACQLFCLPLDPLWCEKFTYSSAPIVQPQEEKNTPETLRNPPSTIMIVNISNSTLINCAIGDSNPSAVAECQPLMQGSELQKHAEARCRCCHGQQGEAQAIPPSPTSCHAMPPEGHLNISIDSSHLNYVIIGDNNYMHAEHNQPFY